MWGIGLAVTAAVAAFVRFCPKKKLMDAVGPWAYKLGKLCSGIGNIRIGKKAMDKIEEGIICTLLGVGMHILNEFGRGLVSDNNEKGS
jgi:hypothetical protein